MDTTDTSKLAVQGGGSNIGIIQVHVGGGEAAGDLCRYYFTVMVLMIRLQEQNVQLLQVQLEVMVKVIYVFMWMVLVIDNNQDNQQQMKDFALQQQVVLISVMVN